MKQNSLKTCLLNCVMGGAAWAAAGQNSSVPASSGPATGGPPAASAGLVNDWLRQQSTAASHWDLGGQFRLRYEDRENAGSFPQNDFIRQGVTNSNNFLLLRERLHLGWTPESWVKFYVEGRNSTSDGDRRQPSPDSDKYDLHQGYLALGDAKQFPLLAKVGRQEMPYGDERFLGKNDWNNMRRTFDAAKLRLENEKLWVDAFAARQVLPYDDRFNVVNDDDWLFGGYASSQKLVPWQETELFFLSHNTGNHSLKVVTPTAIGAFPGDVYTLGTRWKSLPGKLRGWDYGVELAGQFGNVWSITTPGQRLKLETFGAFVSGGHTWTKAWGAPRLGVGYDYGSGDNNPDDQTSHTFQNLFPTLHSVYGQMNLFSERNMHIPRISASISPVKGLTISVDYLLYWMADRHDLLYPSSAAGRIKNGYGIHPGFDSYVGSELDVVANYSIKSWGNLQLGGGHYFVGGYIEQSVGSVPKNGGAVDANWFYVQTTINF